MCVIFRLVRKVAPCSAGADIVARCCFLASCSTELAHGCFAQESRVSDSKVRGFVGWQWQDGASDPDLIVGSSFLTLGDSSGESMERSCTEGRSGAREVKLGTESVFLGIS